MLDVKIILEEFNPCPANPDSKDICKVALSRAWSDPTDINFAFIYRPPRVGTVYYYRGFNEEIKLNIDFIQQSKNASHISNSQRKRDIL